MKRLQRYKYDFLDDYDSTDVDDILNNRKYFTKKDNTKKTLVFIEKCLLVY